MMAVGPPALVKELRQMGFKDIDEFGWEEMNSRYFGDRTDGLGVGSSGHRLICAGT